MLILVPVQAAISSVSRAVASFHPASMPALSRGHYRLELLVWSLLPIAMGAVEGGVTGVIAKNAFAGHVDEARLNLAVAILAGAPAFANIMSFVWPAISHGKHKIRLLSTLQALSVSFLLFIAFAPLNDLGLWMLMLGAIGARVTWSGVIMLRTTVWQANYPRTARATLAGKLATVQAIVMAATAGTIGLALDASTESFRIVYPAAWRVASLALSFIAGCGCAGMRRFSLLSATSHTPAACMSTRG